MSDKTNQGLYDSMVKGAAEAQKHDDDAVKVKVTDVRMGFWSMVVFMVKWAIASIPAMIIVAIITAVLWGVVTS